MREKIEKLLDKLADLLGISPQQKPIPIPVKNPEDKRKR
jgi:hypothetical protein